MLGRDVSLDCPFTQRGGVREPATASIVRIEPVLREEERAQGVGQPGGALLDPDVAETVEVRVYLDPRMGAQFATEYRVPCAECPPGGCPRAGATACLETETESCYYTLSSVVADHIGEPRRSDASGPKPGERLVA